MYLWRKAADPCWLIGREERLQARARGTLAITARPARKRVQLEIACQSRSQARCFIRDFGGWIEKLPRNWWKRLERDHKSKPLKIGKRLLILRSPSAKELASEKLETLIIPASAGFGTGEHPTTAMSLRLLEQITRGLKPGWSLVDLGTGRGILALAARCFGAERVAAIDIDRTAVSIAKTNARLNRIANVDFQLGDVRRWNSVCKIDVVTANLFSELLIEILPKLKRSRWLILSGVLRTQEKEFVRALWHDNIDIVEVRRRGKWIAVLAKSSACVPLEIKPNASRRLAPLWI